MSLPDFDKDGYLPPGIHAASLAEVTKRFGTESHARRRQAELLRQVVESAKAYTTIKRVLVWGSFVTAKLEPADLDYSIVVSITHRQTKIKDEHRRFFVPHEARLRYGVDRGYLVIPDYPPDIYIEFMEFLCHTRERRERGIVEVNHKPKALVSEANRKAKPSVNEVNIHGETTMEVNQDDPK